jgi:hypothetical protein
LITIEWFPPLPRSREGLPANLDERFPIKVVAVVEVDFGSWIEAVN